MLVVLDVWCSGGFSQLERASIQHRIGGFGIVFVGSVLSPLLVEHVGLKRLIEDDSEELKAIDPCQLKVGTLIYP